jgi:hypothetical protein
MLIFTIVEIMSTSNTDENGLVQPYSPKSTTRGRTYHVWEHCTEYVVMKDKNARAITYMYCHKSFLGGGINRPKKHLAGVGGDVR